MAGTILILTSRTGGGHISLADALRDRLLQSNQQYTIESVDPQSRFFHWHYRLVSRYALWLWAAEFRAIDNQASSLLAHRLFTRTVARSLQKVIARLQPDVIITTYPFLSYEVVEVIRKMQDQLQRDIPLVMLFADPNGVHYSWLTEKRAAATLAPTRETYAQALGVGFSEQRLFQVGWPVRQQFVETALHYTLERRSQMLQRLELDPSRFTIFLQGGGEGAARFGETVERVLAMGEGKLQIILATGTNQALQNRFRRIPNIYALPFTKEIAQYMAAADVIMGKAGPNMLFESVTLGKPFIATSYIPGQEQANLEFIQRHKLGWVALHADQQIALLHKLLVRPAELEEMTKSVAVYRDWNTEQTSRIVPIIEGLIQ